MPISSGQSSFVQIFICTVQYFELCFKNNVCHITRWWFMIGNSMISSDKTLIVLMFNLYSGFLIAKVTLKFWKKKQTKAQNITKINHRLVGRVQKLLLWLNFYGQSQSQWWPTTASKDTVRSLTSSVHGHVLKIPKQAYFISLGHTNESNFRHQTWADRKGETV